MNRRDATYATKIFRSWWTLVAFFVIVIGQVLVATIISPASDARVALIIWSAVGGGLAVLALYIHGEKIAKRELTEELVGTVDDVLLSHLVSPRASWVLASSQAFGIVERAAGEDDAVVIAQVAAAQGSIAVSPAQEASLKRVRERLSAIPAQ
jgi:hypothetical protein